MTPAIGLLPATIVRQASHHGPPEGIQIGKSHGHSVIRAHDITQALTQRDNSGTRWRGQGELAGEAPRGRGSFPTPSPTHFPRF